MVSQVTQSTAFKLMPGSQAPSLEIQTLDGTTWKLADQSPKNFTMVVFYRGLHCPICKSYIATLDQKLDEFAQLGVEAIAISGDSQERAQTAKADWGIKNVAIGYGQSAESMRQWGLYISKGASENEPALFGEPGLFLVKPDGLLYYVGINNAPYGRPTFDEMLMGIGFVLPRNYPTRGTE
ncbi:MAG: peroxiredoxin-like family protein [Elainellaceae cyanobacterium]